MDSAKRSYSDWGMLDRAQTIEYRLAEWLRGQQPRGRVFATGGLRFRLNAWTPLHQVGGTFESGLRNRIAVDYYYQTRTGDGSKPGDETSDALRELAAIGAEYVVVHGLQSEEYYKDFKNPAKFLDAAPVVFRATDHDWVHRLPFAGFAHLVRPGELPANKYFDTLSPLAAAIADPVRPKLRTTEEHPGRYRVEGPVRPGDEVFFSMNFDPGWTATQDGRPVPVEPNRLGLMQLKAQPAAASRIVLEYTGTGQQKLFAALSGLVWIVSMALWRRSQGHKGGSTTSPSPAGASTGPA
jgi:hypothetical protein